MANTSTNKPVNDLIKFWAEKQEKKGLEPGSRSLRKPLFPNASLPTTPLDGSFFSKSSFGDIPSNSPPLSPTEQSQSIHSLITDDKINSTIDIQKLPKKNEEKMDVNSLSQNNSSNGETSPYSVRPHDSDLNGRDISNKAGPLPPTRKVTDLVSRFEKVSSPTNSVSTSPKLNPIKRSYQSFPTSPLALSPVNRNQLTPEPLLLSSPTSLTINTKALRRQTVPEPLNISSKQISDEPESISSSPVQPTAPKKDSTSISSITPIDHKTTVSTENNVKEVQIQKKQTYPVQQETLSNQPLKNNDTTTQKKVSEQNSNPVIIPSIKQSDPEPKQQIQLSSSPTHSDYLEFLSATLQSFQTSSFEITSISPTWKPTNESAPISSQNGNKKVSKIRSKHLSIGSKKTFTSREITLKNNEPNPSHYETPDLLPQPEPISPIRLDFSDFLLSSNRSPNLNSNDKQDGEKEKRDFLNTNQSDIHKVVKPEVPKKDEFSYPSATKHMSLKGTVHIIENLKRYLQPNKLKNPNEVNVASARKVASQ